jgi:hypothetical protein
MHLLNICNKKVRISTILETLDRVKGSVFARLFTTARVKKLGKQVSRTNVFFQMISQSHNIQELQIMKEFHLYLENI